MLMQLEAVFKYLSDPAWTLRYAFGEGHRRKSLSLDRYWLWVRMSGVTGTTCRGIFSAGAAFILGIAVGLYN